MKARKEGLNLSKEFQEEFIFFFFTRNREIVKEKVPNFSRGLFKSIHMKQLKNFFKGSILASKEFFQDSFQINTKKPQR